MTYDGRSRDRFRWAVAAATGLAACAGAAVTGALTGMAEADLAEDTAKAAGASTKAPAGRERRPRVVVKERPVRTRVVTRVVRVTVGGGQVSAPAGTTSSPSTSSSSTSSGPGRSGDSGSSGPGPAPQPPAPEPPPTQSSGS